MDRRSIAVSLVTFVFIATFGSLASPARAVNAIRNWTNSAGGLFSDAANWTALPDSADLAVFNLAGEYTVQFNADATTKDLDFINNADVTFDLGGQKYTVTNPTQRIDGSASLTVTNGWLQMPAYRIGESGAGTLTIGNGGRITGSSTNGYVGYNAGSTGAVTITSSAENYLGHQVSLGYLGTGSLTIAAGGFLQSNVATIGYSAVGEGTAVVTGGGSVWNLVTTDGSGGYGEVGVGNLGKGSLTISDGGTVNSWFGYIGRYHDSVGTVTVTGAGSTWNNNAPAGAPRLLFVGGDKYYTSGPGNQGQGTLIVSDGGLVKTGTSMTIWPTGTLSGSGGTVQGTVTNEGLISPGASAGNLTIDGTLTQTTGKLAMELAGASSYDQLLVTGQFALGGTLEVKLLGGYMPAAGSLFNILDWGSSSGTFSVLDLPALDGGKTWNTSQLYSNGVLTVSGAPIIPGDFDSDGDVDGADFVAWQTNFPKTSFATLSQGDADNDGDVDGADFVIWQTNFPSSPVPAAVPEPSTLFLALLSSIALAGHILRRQ